VQGQKLHSGPESGAQGLDIEKLANLLGMSASANDHEALAFIRKANEMVLRSPYRWPNLLKAPDSPPPPRQPKPHKRPIEMSVGEMIEYCARHAHSLSPNQRTFIFNIRHRHGWLSPKQLKYLLDLAHQVEAFR
jgi:hypothetical protein